MDLIHIGQEIKLPDTIYSRSTLSQKEQAKILSLFDPAYYASENPDVVKAYGSTPERLWAHFLEYGLWETRQPNANFNINAYGSAYSDLREAFKDENRGKTVKSLILHYAEFGISENRELTTIEKCLDAGNDVLYYGSYDNKTEPTELEAVIARRETSVADSRKYLYTETRNLFIGYLDLLRAYLIEKADPAYITDPTALKLYNGEYTSGLTIPEMWQIIFCDQDDFFPVATDAEAYDDFRDEEVDNAMEATLMTWLRDNEYADLTPAVQFIGRHMITDRPNTDSYVGHEIDGITYYATETEAASAYEAKYLDWCTLQNFAEPKREQYQVALYADEDAADDAFDDWLDMLMDGASAYCSVDLLDFLEDLIFNENLYDENGNWHPCTI